MKVYIDQGKDHTLTRLMLPYWTGMGVEIVPLEDADIHLSYVNLTKKSRIPKILRLDGIYYNIKSPFMIANQPLMNSYKLAQGVIMQSHYAREFAFAIFGPTAAKTIVIYNGADPSWNLPLKHEGFNIVITSNWRRWKREEEMVSVFEDCLATYPDWTLHIVGPNSVMKSHPKVRYLGVLDHPRLQTMYSIMDASMHLAKRDWCPNSLLELTAAGIPTVVSDKGGGSTELMEKINPELIAIDDADAVPLFPCEQYTNAWNTLPPYFRTNVCSKLQSIYHGYIPRVTLPEELTAQHVATAYFNFMKEFV